MIPKKKIIVVTGINKSGKSEYITHILATNPLTASYKYKSTFDFIEIKKAIDSSNIDMICIECSSYLLDKLNIYLDGINTSIYEDNYNIEYHVLDIDIQSILYNWMKDYKHMDKKIEEHHIMHGKKSLDRFISNNSSTRQIYRVTYYTNYNIMKDILQLCNYKFIGGYLYRKNNMIRMGDKYITNNIDLIRYKNVDFINLYGKRYQALYVYKMIFEGRFIKTKYLMSIIKNLSNSEIVEMIYKEIYRSDINKDYTVVQYNYNKGEGKECN